MINIEDDQVAAMLDYTTLADALETAFRIGETPPPRQHFELKTEGKTDGHLLLMPAWQPGGSIGVKIVSVFPDNAALDIPTVNAAYLLLNGKTGVPELTLDATEMTRRRTAAASALAARYLAREDCRVLLMVGTGAMASHLIRAHCATRPIEIVRVWGRSREKARIVAEQFHDEPYEVDCVTDLHTAVSTADIVSCATLSRSPLIRGDWLRPGQHLDLIGSFTPDMREVDDSALSRARIFVDTRSVALQESGELVQGIRDGVITESDVLGDFFDLTRGECAGRVSDDDITIFKSVGTSLEDLVAANLVAAQA